MTDHPVPDAALDADICTVAQKGAGRDRRLAVVRTCSCGSAFRPWATNPEQRFCSRRCWLKTQHTREHQQVAGKAAGKILAARLRGTGSKHPYIKRDGRHEHRVVAEETLGRPLLPGELVHHRDEHGKNNAPTNLQVTDRPEHARIHFTGSKQSPEHVRKRVESARRTRAANAAARQPA